MVLVNQTAIVLPVVEMVPDPPILQYLLNLLDFLIISLFCLLASQIKLLRRAHVYLFIVSIVFTSFAECWVVNFIVRAELIDFFHH